MALRVPCSIQLHLRLSEALSESIKPRDGNQSLALRLTGSRTKGCKLGAPCVGMAGAGWLLTYVTESLERACIACFNHEKRERLVLYEL
jgi:hypothetical protein